MVLLPLLILLFYHAHLILFLVTLSLPHVCLGISVTYKLPILLAKDPTTTNRLLAWCYRLCESLHVTIQCRLGPANGRT